MENLGLGAISMRFVEAFLNCASSTCIAAADCVPAGGVLSMPTSRDLSRVDSKLKSIGKIDEKPWENDEKRRKSTIL